MVSQLYDRRWAVDMVPLIQFQTAQLEFSYSSLIIPKIMYKESRFTGEENLYLTDLKLL